MTSYFKPLLIAAMLAGAGLATGAHAMGMGMGGHHGDGQRGQHQRMDPARMQQMMAQRQAELKAKPCHWGRPVRQAEGSLENPSRAPSRSL